jgi:RNA polymerase sigma factor (sigma-70 family)
VPGHRARHLCWRAAQLTYPSQGTRSCFADSNLYNICGRRSSTGTGGYRVRIRSMAEQDSEISQVIAGERSRLRNFIRKRVPNEADVEDLLQEVFSELVEANRLLMPIDHVTGWLFRVARNRIIDLFRKKRPEAFGRDPLAVSDEGEALLLEEVLASPDAGPAEAYARAVLLEEIEEALDELPEEQRDVFVAHEIEGYSFKEIAARTGVSINTLLSRKRYSVLHLRERLRKIYEEFRKK